jgi:hypothetical protein
MSEEDKEKEFPPFIIEEGTYRLVERSEEKGRIHELYKDEKGNLRYLGLSKEFDKSISNKYFCVWIRMENGNYVLCSNDSELRPNHSSSMPVLIPRDIPLYQIKENLIEVMGIENNADITISIKL